MTEDVVGTFVDQLVIDERGDVLVVEFDIVVIVGLKKSQPVSRMKKLNSIHSIENLSTSFSPIGVCFEMQYTSSFLEETFL
jgi:hypothetical protein